MKLSMKLSRMISGKGDVPELNQSFMAKGVNTYEYAISQVFPFLSFLNVFFSCCDYGLLCVEFCGHQ